MKASPRGLPIPAKTPAKTYSRKKPKFPHHPIQSPYRYSALVALVTIVNIFGIQLVGWSLVGLAAMILLPFTVFFFYQTPMMYPPTQWAPVPPAGDIDWGLFLSVGFWLYAGWDDMGTFAGEVKDGPRTYVVGTLLAFIAIVVAYLMPVAAGLSVDPDWTNWEEGYFVVMAFRVGDWLGWWTRIGSCLSLFGLYTSMLACTSRAFWSMAQGPSKQLPAIFGFTWSRFNTPIFSILALAPVTLVLMELPFASLVEITTVMNCITLIAEFASFLKFRYAFPDKERPFKIPGGFPIAWIVCITMWLLVLVTLVFTNWYFLLGAIIVDIIFVIFYYLKKTWVERCHAPALRLACYRAICIDGEGDEDWDAKE